MRDGQGHDIQGRRYATPSTSPAPTEPDSASEPQHIERAPRLWRTVERNTKKPWQVVMICCERDDGMEGFDSWNEADTFRNQYVATSEPNGHQRQGIIYLRTPASTHPTRPEAIKVADSLRATEPGSASEPQTLGLYGKYRVTKANGEELDGPVFVLRYDRDSHARIALRAYADDIVKENPDLATDLWDALGLLGESVGPSR